jgi:hypothetical protein
LDKKERNSDLNDDEENKTSYLNQKIEEEKAHKETNDKFFERFDGCCGNSGNFVRKYFLKDPYGTLWHLIKNYQDRKYWDILINLNYLKNQYKI